MIFSLYDTRWCQARTHDVYNILGAKPASTPPLCTALDDVLQFKMISEKKIVTFQFKSY